jgi:hypothetical protein
MSENAGTSADSTGGTSPTDPYAEGVKTLRETAKWLTTAFAALGTAMLAGTQLSKIGQLGLADLRLWVAVAAGTLALSAVGVVIWNVTRVLAPEWVSIHELIQDQEDQRQTDDLEFVEKNKYLYTGYDTIKALRENYDRLVRERDALVAQENWDKAKKRTPTCSMSTYYNRGSSPRYGPTGGTDDSNMHYVPCSNGVLWLP